MLTTWAESGQAGGHLGPLPSLDSFQQGHVEQLSVRIQRRESHPHLNTIFSLPWGTKGRHSLLRRN